MALTINIPYFNDGKYLLMWLDHMYELEEYTDVQFCVCDDASTKVSAESIIRSSGVPRNLKLYRVKDNLGFNAHGCRNLMMKETTTEWNLLIDVDNLFISSDRIKDLDSLVKNPDIFYILYPESGRSNNTFLITKQCFWRASGYDEETTGIHAGDTLFLNHGLRKYFKEEILEGYHVEVRYGRNVYYKKHFKDPYPDDDTLFHNIRVERWMTIRDMCIERYRNNIEYTKPIIRFNWERLI